MSRKLFIDGRWYKKVSYKEFKDLYIPKGKNKFKNVYISPYGSREILKATHFIKKNGDITVRLISGATVGYCQIKAGHGYYVRCIDDEG